ncbi:hypothetical protein [Pelagibius sp. 7325]|uniref:hypothetical protein n=1 Tax=Pelagibius sp. 7325 TaxID=3131994 RepID=UPI0030EF3355
MLSSLQDLSGLFPGLFQRGESASAEQAANQAARGLGEGRGQRHQVDRHHLDQGHGRDRVSLSPQAQAVEEAVAQDDGETASDVAESGNGSLLGQAGGFIRQALETIRTDLGKALKAFGFDSAAVQEFTQAFVEPVLAALKEGVNFTAELSFAAFSQVTKTSSNGDFSQSTALVAQSLEIAVNQDTGEVSVSVAKISFEQQIQSTGGGALAGGGQTPLLVIDPDDLATPQELAAKILASGDAAAIAAAEAADAAAAEETAETIEGEKTPATGEPDKALAQLREKLAEDALSFQTRLTIYSVSTYQNDKGETITKLLLDAQLKIAGFAGDTQNNDATAQEEAESLNLTA